MTSIESWLDQEEVLKITILKLEGNVWCIQSLVSDVFDESWLTERTTMKGNWGMDKQKLIWKE